VRVPDFRPARLAFLIVAILLARDAVALSACVHDADCNDHNACTQDRCSGLTCQHTAIVCNDGDPCTADTCSAATGCAHSAPRTCDDGNPCNGFETCDPGGGCRLGAPPFFARRGGHVGNAGTVEADLAANDPGATLAIGRGARLLDGTTLTADTVKLGVGTSVFNLRSNRRHFGVGSTVAGSVATVQLPVADPFCFLPALACGGTDVVLARGETAGPILPGSYGKVVLPNDTTLLLLPGTYGFCSVKGGRGAKIRVLGATPTTVDVVGSFLLGGNAEFSPLPGTPVPTLEVGGTALHLGPTTRIQAWITAPHAGVRFGRSVELDGTFCADVVGTDNNARLACTAP
jgi:hypothetical protein